MITEILEKEKVDLLIPITEPSEQFAKHLNEKGNHRILFSSPFGTGKTTFLKEFFKGKEEKYKVFHLYPVNYQVADNKDIFELLKFDILTELIPSIDFDTPGYDLTDKLLASQYFLMNNGANLAFDILKGIPKLGKTVNSFEKIIKFCSGLHESFKQPENEKFSILEEYAQGTELKQGSIYEMDSISHFISEEIKKLTDEGDGEKESVLIIDDLDRVDPRHIFRLLNVFSAHFDQDYPINNKFGFSKIIMVCDIENIEIIYRKMYGEKVDFKGYIDKFRSVETFLFDNIDSWKSKLDQLSSQIKLKNCNEYDSSRTFNEFITPIVIDLLNNGQLNVRQLLKLDNFPVKISVPNKFKFKEFRSITHKNVYFGYCILLFLYDGNIQNFKSHFSTLIEIDECRLRSKIQKEFVQDLIEILKYRSHESSIENTEKMLIGGHNVEFKIARGRVIIDVKHFNSIRPTINFYKICQEAFEVFDEVI